MAEGGKDVRESAGKQKRGQASFLAECALRSYPGHLTRVARAAPPGYVYHVLKRVVARLPLFQKEGDCDAFERVLSEALQEHPTRLLAYCLMPNHWHFVVWPRQQGELTAFAQWLTPTHTMRWPTHYHTLGSGHVYQGRFKSFQVQADEHFYHVVRYVERNALRATLVQRAEDWRWSSLWRRQHADAHPTIALADWPLSLLADWLESVKRPQTEAELQAVRRSVNREAPYGNPAWQLATAARYHLEHTLRPRGRPRKRPLPPSPPRLTAITRPVLGLSSFRFCWPDRHSLRRERESSAAGPAAKAP
jgi:putative transposase